MRDPFKIDSPTCISFSGGRTSAYMLWKVLQSNGGLPNETLVCFANTGKEEEATLRFIDNCSKNWNVPITWIEYRNGGYVIVDFSSASRNGEPFEMLIKKLNYVPNPVTRVCTYQLKIRPMDKYCRSVFGEKTDRYTMVGIRADEHRRVTKIRNRVYGENKHEIMSIPLADAGITVQDVTAFWNSQPFDLELTTYNGRTLAGNCDLCFLKPAAQIQSLINEKPSRAIWWSQMEVLALALAFKPDGARFRKDRPSYAQMMNYSKDQQNLFPQDEEGIACFCGD